MMLDLMNVPLVATLFIVLAHTSILGAVPGGEALAGLITSQFDTNANDIIDQGEWSTGIAGSFGDLDSDGDGFIASDEVDHLKPDIAGETGDFAASIIVVLIQKIVLSLDADSNGLVSREEFEEPSIAFFTQLDADSDTHLTTSELADLPIKVVTATKAESDAG